jgi:cobalt-zinc-cadmium efflux system protein
MNKITDSEHIHDHQHVNGNNHEHNHNHAREMRKISKQKLWTAFFIIFSFMIVEIFGGIISNSLALMADAGHMFTDVAALLLAILVARLAEKEPTPTRTYGLLRAEILGAFANGAALVIIVGIIFWQALKRFGGSYEINSQLMIIVALAGLGANIASAMVLYKNRNVTVNMKGAFLHVVADGLGSIAAVISGIVIFFTGWVTIDPIASIVIGILILWSSWGLIKENINILLESTPENIDYNEVKNSLESIEHIKEVNDLHIWTISTGIPSLSAHVQLQCECSDSNHWQLCLKEAQDMLKNKFGIEHSTLQFEPESMKTDCSLK